MKRMLLTALLILSPFLLSAEPSPEDIDYDRLSETLGHLIVKGLDQPGFRFNLEKVIEGIRQEKAGQQAPMSEEEYEQAIYQIQEQQFTKMAQQNLLEANAFLKENATKKNVHEIDSKLHYLILQTGNGEIVGPDSSPLIHYTGKLIDGTVFASSADVGEPVVLPIKQSITGFSKGLVGMKEGEKRILYIHPELAHGLSAKLPPNSLLIFEVEVVKANAILPDCGCDQNEETTR